MTGRGTLRPDSRPRPASHQAFTAHVFLRLGRSKADLPDPQRGSRLDRRAVKLLAVRASAVFDGRTR
jgi:hypothetical protein